MFKNFKHFSLSVFSQMLVLPNTTISVFQVIGLKILGRVGTHNFFREKFDFMHFERHFSFQNA